VKQVCKAFRVSRSAYYAAQPPTERRPRKVTSRPVVSVEDLRDAIQRVVDSQPAWGVRKVWARLRREDYDVRVSRKRVYATMKSMDLVFTAAERHEKRHLGSVAVPESNRLWATDLTTVWTKRDGLVAVAPVIDCGDRLLLDFEVTKSQMSHDILRPVERALMAAFQAPAGVPFELGLRSDHGPQYTGYDCQELCRIWGIDHTFSPVRRPTGNAVAERLIETMKEEVIWQRDWESADELLLALKRWQRVYNTERPHQALNWETPAERRARNLARPLDALLAA